MNEEFSNESPKKDLGFILSLAALLLFTLMGIGIDSDEYLQQNDLNIPGFYFVLIFLIDLLMVVSLILIFFYRKIGELALKSLRPNGKLFFEINQYLGKETVDLLNDLGFQNVELRKDIYGNDRMILASL